MATATARKPVIHLPQQINPLEEAEHILRTDGWTVGTFKCDEGKRCAVGALRVACGMRETTGVTRFRNKSYLQSLLLLATAIDKKYKTSDLMSHQIRSVTTTPYFEEPRAFDSLTRDQKVQALEQFVWEYNDDKTEDAKGRQSVLRKFRSAARRFISA